MTEKHESSSKRRKVVQKHKRQDFPDFCKKDSEGNIKIHKAPTKYTSSKFIQGERIR